MAAALCAAAPYALADKAAAAAAGVDLDVAYCESTGQQYIDTGILGNPGLRVEAEIAWLGTNLTSSADQHILGSYDKVNGNPWRCYPISMSGARYPFFHYGDKQNTLSFHYVIGQRYRVVSDLGASEQSFSADGLDGSAAYTFTSHQNYTSISSGKTLYLFALGHGTRDDGVNCMTMARVYWLKIYQGGNLVRDYRPARQGDVYRGRRAGLLCAMASVQRCFRHLHRHRHHRMSRDKGRGEVPVESHSRPSFVLRGGWWKVFSRVMWSERRDVV